MTKAALLAITALAALGAAPQAPAAPTVKVRAIDVTTGEPMPNVSIALRCFAIDGAMTPGVEGYTNRQGEMTSPIDRGDCLVYGADAPGYSREVSVRRYEMGAGETVITVRLRRRGSVSGTLVDQNRRPIPDAVVLLLTQVRAAGALDWSSSRFFTVATNARGEFRFADVQAGSTYRLDVPSIQSSQPIDAFTLKPGESHKVELEGTRLPTFRVSGHLRAAANLGFVTAFLDRSNSSPARPLTIAESKADASGAFTFTGVPAGSYRIRVDTSASSGGYSPSDILAASLPIVVDGDVTDLSVPLSPGNEVSGTVAFEGATPAPPEWSNVIIAFSAASGRPAGIVQARGTVGTRFWTRSLLPDTYFLRVALTPQGPWRL